MKNISSLKTDLTALHADYKQSYLLLSESNWQETITTYLEKIKTISSNDNERRLIAGWLASYCERAYYLASYQKPLEKRKEFEKELISIFSGKDLPDMLKTSGPVICGKKQPSFLQSLKPTLARFEIIEGLSKAFNGAVDSIIIGGSMSYVPFFGIREDADNKDFSDIDAIFIVNERIFGKEFQKDFLKDGFFPIGERENFLSRLSVYRRLADENRAEVLSQRFSIVDQSFTISIHFMSYPSLKKILLTNLTNPLTDRTNTRHTLHDFKVDLFELPCYAQHSFDRSRFESEISCKKFGPNEYISEVPTSVFFNGKFYPGVFQTVVYPALRVFYSKDKKVPELVNDFRTALYKEVQISKKDNPRSSYAKAHNRYEIFPPGRYDDGHDSYILPTDFQEQSPLPEIESIALKEDNLSNNSNQLGEKQARLNKQLRSKVISDLTNLKTKTLKDLQSKIEHFISGDLQPGKYNRKWYSVATVPHELEMAVKLPVPYVVNNSLVRKELFLAKISPHDIMRLPSYERLERKFGKAYIATNNESNEQTNQKAKISYTIIVQIK